MVNIIPADQMRNKDYLDAVLRIYEDLVRYMDFPTVNSIYGNYCLKVDHLIIQLQVKAFPDDIYDGTPGTIPNFMIPDYMKENLGEYIGIPPDISEEIIIEILEDYQMFYVHQGYKNSPIRGVW